MMVDIAHYADMLETARRPPITDRVEVDIDDLEELLTLARRARAQAESEAEWADYYADLEARQKAAGLRR